MYKTYIKYIFIFSTLSFILLIALPKLALVSKNNTAIRYIAKSIQSPSIDLSINNTTNIFDKIVIIGAGSGRCGTLSAAYFLNLQSQSNVTHEKINCGIARWNDSFSEEQFSNIASKIYKRLSKKSGYIVGDVASWYLPYINYLMKYENVMAFILKRDKNDTIESWMKWTNGTNHWINESVRKASQYKASTYDKCFPTYNILNNTSSKRKAITLYYDDYYERSKKLIETYPNRILLVDSYDFLNDEKTQKELLTKLKFIEPFHYEKIISHPTNKKKMSKIMASYKN